MLRTHRPMARVIAPALGVLALISLASCSSDDKSSDKTTTTVETSTTAASGESAATVAFDKDIQQELKDVGCYTGADDGIIGPETDAAIVAFQTAEGLEADGEFGPETEAALTKAVDDGTKVCDGSVTTTTAAGTTTTAANGGEAPCTATAISAALDGEALASYVCSDGYAAGTVADTQAKFILQSEDGTWAEMTQDPCGTASAGLPPVILEDGCEG
ncbi:MAG: peptidoglycan-binding domain-containing protein [Aquihabitans sp.]